MQLSKKCTEQKGLKPFENCNQLEKSFNRPLPRCNRFYRQYVDLVLIF